MTRGRPGRWRCPTYGWAKGRVGEEVLDLIAKELHIEMN